MKTSLKHLWTALCAAFCLIALAPTHAQQPAFLTNGLVAYYPFNGDAKDASPNRGTGNIFGATFAPNRFNQAGTALYFDGVDDYVSGPPVNIQNNHSVFAAWVKTDSMEIPSRSAVSIPRHSFGSGMRISVENGLFDHPYPPAPKNFASDNTWHHWAVKWDGHLVTGYIDGKNVGSHTNRGEHFLNLDVQIGRETIDDIGDGSGKRHLKAIIDDVRIYHRALSDNEVKALYDFESQPPTSNPRIATAVAQVVNGFVVGATVTDGGSGYTNAPAVTITGGSGTGARGVASIANGTVNRITITNPGIGYTSTPTLTLAPPPFPPRRAVASSQVVNGFVVGATVADAGFGYGQPPVVLLTGGGGSGAKAVATVANGVVTGITITHPGIGYTSAPTVRIASPPFSPTLSVEVSRVNVAVRVTLGGKYQIESTTDLSTWIPTGPAFVAEDEDLIQEFPVDTVGRMFRINQVP